MKANDLHNFKFQFAGAGHYRVTYTTEKRGDYWVATITDMTLIDATKNADWVKVADIEALRKAVIAHGTHYNSMGHPIHEEWK